MPNPAEICVVTINGTIFRDWETVRAEADASNNGIRYVTLTITEKSAGPGVVAQTLQIEPGTNTMASVTLAGQLFCNGNVYERQASYDANNHGVRIIICGLPQPLVQSTIPLKSGQFKNYTYQAIAASVLMPFGLNLKVASAPDGFDKPFRYVATIPGEPAWTFLERLARMRGAALTDDEQGNVVVHGKAQTSASGDLVEGQNIIAANCVIQYPVSTAIQTTAQQKGSDTITPDQARAPAAKGAITGTGSNRPSHVHNEDAGDADDARRRADSEQLVDLARCVTAQIVVQGWLKPSGELWKIRDLLNVNSPMLLLDKGLYVNKVTFSQDTGGTLTTLELNRDPVQGGAPALNSGAQPAMVST